MKIHYLTPYSLDKNIGRAYNEACSNIPGDEDWIVIRDGDTMFLTPQWGVVINDVLKEHGSGYALLGAKTNRVKEFHHLEEGMFDNMNIMDHYEVARDCQEFSRLVVKHTIFDIAGFFMAFQKKTWAAVGGFDENTPVFDRIFTRKVRSLVGKVGVMQGVYVLHAYRLWAEDARNSDEHLHVPTDPRFN